jgi:thiol-disulfide isomerase/thioredoxin
MTNSEEHGKMKVEGQKALLGPMKAYQVIMLSAPWCKQCPAMDKALDEWVRTRRNIDKRKLDVESPEGQQLASNYMLMSVPQVLFFKGEDTQPFAIVQTVKQLNQVQLID